MIRHNVRQGSVLAASIAAAVLLLFTADTAVAQTYPTLNTGSSVMWNTTLWTLGGTPPQTSTQVGLLQGGGTMTIDATSTNTTPGGLLIGWQGNFNVAMTSGTLTVGTFGDAVGTGGLVVGESGVGTFGTFSQTGGLVTAPLVNLGRQDSTSAGTYTLTGGTLATAQILRGAGAGTLNLNGGTIQVTATAASLIGSTLTTVVQTGGAFIDTNGFNTMVTSALSGSGRLTKIGSGMLTLTATNTFTGGVTVAGGTLQIGNNSTQFPVPGFGSGYTLANGATLVFSFNTANNAGGSAPISGTGNVVFAGGTSAGTYYSTNAFGANGLTYTGTTTINFDNAVNVLYVEAAAGMTLPSTTILNVLRGGVRFRQSQTVAGLSGTGGTIEGSSGTPTLTINVASGTSYTSASALIDNGTVLTLTKAGGGTQVLTGSSTYTGTTTINAGTLQIGSGTAGSLSASTVITGSAGGTLAFGRTDGYGGNVANSIRGGIGLAVNSGILSLTGSNTFSGGTVVNGGVLAISTTSALPGWNVANSLTVNTGAGVAVGNAVADGDVATLLSTGSNFRAGSSIGFDTTAGNRTYTPSIADTAQGALGLAKVGANTFAVTGSNTFSGMTTIAGGVLSLGNASALGGGGNVLFTGGTLQFTSSNTVDLSARIQGSTSAVAIDTNGQSVTFASSIVSSNAGGLTKSGSGTLALNGNNTFAGASVIAGGVLQAGGTGTLSSGTITFSGGTLQYTAATAGTDWATRIKSSGSAIALDTNGQNVTLAGIIDNTNTGGLTKTGNGTLVLSASTAYTGLTTVSQGVLQSGSTTAATTAIPTGNYAVAAGAKLVFARNVDTVAFTTQSISGTGDVEFTGQAAGYFTFRATGLAFSGALTYTGQTIVNLGTSATWYQGALWLEKDNVLPSATVLNLRSGKVVTRNQTGTGISIAGITGSAGTFITTDATGGTQKWTTTVTSGSSHTYAGVIGWDGVAGGVSQANGNNISFTKAGAGTQVLSGVNTYTGTTTINAGRLEIASTGRINGTARIVLNGSGAELKYNSATALTQPITFTQGTISGTGTIGTAVTAGANDILSPGNSPGIQAYTSGLTWDPSGTYLWEMNDATSTAGTGWDLLNVSGGSGLVINATSGTTFRIAITSLSGTAAGNANFSATTSGSWTILSSASGITGFAANKFTLDRSAFTNTTGGTFTLSQVASGTNQTLVLAYNTLSALTSSTSAVSGFRVMQNQATTTAMNLVNGGPDATGYSLSASAGLGLTSGSAGTLAASGTQAIAFGYASTATTGARSGTVSFSNTGNTGDTPGSFTVAGAVVADRVVTASAVNYGLVHLGASGTGTSTFTSAGSDTNFTRITVANGSGGGLTVSGSSGFVFDGTGGSSRTVAGSFGTVGAISGTITLTNSSAETGGLLPGQVPGTTAVAYSASVFSGNGIWSGTGGGLWGTGSSSNWTSDEGVAAAPGTFTGYTNTDTATFGSVVSSGTATINLTGVAPSLKSIKFDTGSGSYVLSGGAITLSSDTGTAGLNVSVGTHEIASNLTLTSLAAVEIAPNSVLTLSGTISGSGGFVKTGGGELDLRAANNFSGNTAINDGILKIFNANTFGSGTVTLASGATLNLNNLTIGNTLVNLGGTIINSGSYTGTQTVSGTANYSGSTAGTIDVTTGGNASFAGTVSGSVGISAGATGNFSGGVTGNVNVAGSAVVTSAVGSGASLGIAAGGALTFGNGATVNSAASISNNGQLIVDRSSGTALQIAAGISGSGSLMVNSGVVQLTGASTYAGLTSISGTGSVLTVNGSLTNTTGVQIGTGAMLGGSGVIDAALTGSGLVSPGNSPGIMTASQFDPTGGLDAAFEFTTLSPNYASATGSLNDVLRLTNAVNPFASGAFTAANVIDVYFNVPSITSGQTYEGGFFTEISAASLLAALDGKATFHYWAMTTGTSVDRSFNGSNYVSLTSLPGITGATLQTSYGSKNFGGSVGSVTGSVTQFVIVPEPGAIVIAAAGLAAGWCAWAVRRRSR